MGPGTDVAGTKALEMADADPDLRRAIGRRCNATAIAAIRDSTAAAHPLSCSSDPVSLRKRQPEIASKFVVGRPPSQQFVASSRVRAAAIGDVMALK